LSGDSDSHDTLPPLFSLIRTSYAITDLSLFNQSTPPHWLSQLIRMRLRKQPIHPWDYVPTLQRKQFKSGLNLNTLITTKAPHTWANLHLAATVAKTTISNSTPSCRKPWLLYHTGDIKECTILSKAKTH